MAVIWIEGNGLLLTDEEESTMRRNRGRGTNARGWFYGQSFNGRVSHLETEAQRNADFYQSTQTEEELFGPEPQPDVIPPHPHCCKTCGDVFAATCAHLVYSHKSNGSVTHRPAVAGEFPYYVPACPKPECAFKGF